MPSLPSVGVLLLAVSPSPDLATLAQLDFGPYAVGVRAIRALDTTRTWPAANDPSGERGRPVHITLWYPAAGHERRPLSVEDYVLLDWAGESEPGLIEAERDRALIAARRAFEEGLDAPLTEQQWQKARAVPGAARLDAAPLVGRRALLLFETGFNGRSYFHVPLVEILASNGYVVASLASFGRSETERLGFDLAGVRAQVGDLKVALRVLGARPEVDPARVALLAWSAGGVSQALLRLETPAAFRAAVSLDSGTGYAYGADLLRQAGGYDPERLTVPFLQLDAGEASAVPKDDSFHRAHGRALAERAELPGLRHGDLALPFGVGRAAALEVTPPSLRRLGSVLLAFLGRHVPPGSTTEGHSR
jgi:hypothetical protein